MNRNHAQELRDHVAAGRGILVTLLATVCFAVADTLSKLQAREYPVGMIVWVRYAVPVLFLLAVFLPRHGLNLLRTACPVVQSLRGVLLTTATVFIVLAYRAMPIAEAQAISFIHPVLLTLLAVAFLRERVGRLGWVAIFLCFSGVLFIVRPGSGMFRVAALLPLGQAVCFACYQILTRFVAGKDSTIVSLLMVSLVGTTAMSLALPFSWVQPTGPGLLRFGLIGIASGMGHFLAIRALEHAPASLLAPFGYVQLVWVTILGMLVFGDFPEAMTLAGMATIVGGGLLVAVTRRRPKVPAAV